MLLLHYLCWWSCFTLVSLWFVLTCLHYWRQHWLNAKLLAAHERIWRPNGTWSLDTKVIWIRLDATKAWSLGYWHNGYKKNKLWSCIGEPPTKLETGDRPVPWTCLVGVVLAHLAYTPRRGSRPRWLSRWIGGKMIKDCSISYHQI
jgi:hypothetical protein